MALQQELFRHITTLEAEHQLLKHEWGHAKEEMTEVCLRLGYKKWAAFLEDVRANRLTKVTEYLFNDTIKGGTNMAMSHKKT